MSKQLPKITLPESLLRLPDVLKISGLSRSSLYDRIRQRLFPKQVSLGGRAVAWPANEIAAVNAARIAGKSNDEVRQLVSELQIARKTAV